MQVQIYLNYSIGDTTDLYYGVVSGEINIDGTDTYLTISIPESGDWAMSLSGANQSGIPIPGISDITSLIGFNFLNNLPSSLLFEGIELTGLTLTFPKPTAGVIHTASCKMKLTSDWSFTPLLTLSDIEFQCDMDFTGAQTVVDFEVAGTVTIAGIDLPAYARRKVGNMDFRNSGR